MTTKNNSINLKSAGVVTYNATGSFTGSPLTQYGSLVAGASNAIANAATSATSGVPVCSNGASSNPSFQKAAIAGGGTDAASFTQSNGIVAYNGTSLVNYAGPQISSSGIFNNSTQSKFFAYLGTGGVSNVTGNGTVYTPKYGVTLSNVGSGYSTSTGIFTTPVTGTYLFFYGYTLASLSSSHTSMLASLNAGGTIMPQDTSNPAAQRNVSNQYGKSFSNVLYLSASTSVSVNITVSGGSKSANLLGLTGADIFNYFGGYLLS